MDNLTHTLTGVAIARLGFDRRVPGATLTLALASNLPDLDVVSGLWGTTAYLDHHRGLSHAFAASPFLAAGLALLLSRRRGTAQRFLPTFLLAWLGIGLHIIWDLWTIYGTRVLLPFDATWYTLGFMFIVDPIFLGLLVVGSFGQRWFKTAPIHRFAMVGALAYIGLRAAAQWLAQGQAESLAGSEFTRVLATPDPIRINRWRFIASSDETFATGYVPAFGTSRSIVSFPRKTVTPLAERIARESESARVFLDFSMFPRFDTRLEGDQTVLIWQDLRFANISSDSFRCEVRVDAAGRIVSEKVVF